MCFKWAGPLRVLQVKADNLSEVEDLVRRRSKIVHGRRLLLYCAELDRNEVHSNLPRALSVPRHPFQSPGHCTIFVKEMELSRLKSSGKAYPTRKIYLGTTHHGFWKQCGHENHISVLSWRKTFETESNIAMSARLICLLQELKRWGESVRPCARCDTWAVLSAPNYLACSHVPDGWWTCRPHKFLPDSNLGNKK